MKEKRKYDRIAFFTMGTVAGKSEKIACSLENISDRGALICADNPILGVLQLEDIVRLKTILVSPVEFLCRVTRIEVNRIAVQFLE